MSSTSDSDDDNDSLPSLESVHIPPLVPRDIGVGGYDTDSEDGWSDGEARDQESLNDFLNWDHTVTVVEQRGGDNGIGGDEEEDNQPPAVGDMLPQVEGEPYWPSEDGEETDSDDHSINDDDSSSNDGSESNSSTGSLRRLVASNRYDNFLLRPHVSHRLLLRPTPIFSHVIWATRNIDHGRLEISPMTGRD